MSMTRSLAPFFNGSADYGLLRDAVKQFGKNDFKGFAATIRDEGLTGPGLGALLFYVCAFPRAHVMNGAGPALQRLESLLTGTPVADVRARHEHLRHVNASIEASIGVDAILDSGRPLAQDDLLDAAAAAEKAGYGSAARAIRHRLLQPA